MTFVEQKKTQKAPPEQVTEPPLTLPFWAKSIDEVRPRGDWFVIHGTGAASEPVASTLARKAGMKDLLSDLNDFAPPVQFKARTSDDWRKLSRPALDFLDAKTDEALVDYVNKYGPVLAWACSDGYEVVAAQSLAVLRREQKVFAAAFELKEALGKISQEDRMDLHNAWAEYEPTRDELNKVTEDRLRSHKISVGAYKHLIRSHDNAQQKLSDLKVKLRPKFERIRLAAMTLATLVIEAGGAPMEECPKEIIPHDIWWGVELMAQHQPAWESSAFSSLPLMLKDANYQGAFSLGQSAL